MELLLILLQAGDLADGMLGMASEEDHKTIRVLIYVVVGLGTFIISMVGLGLKMFNKKDKSHKIQVLRFEKECSKKDQLIEKKDGQISQTSDKMHELMSAVNISQVRSSDKQEAKFSAVLEKLTEIITILNK